MAAGSRRPEVMKKGTVILVLALAMLPLSEAVSASEGPKKAEERKVVKVEEKGAFLGIFMAELERETIDELDYPESGGVLVTEVIEDSPAEGAGLMKHDIIYSIDGRKVEDPAELSGMVGEKDPGDEIEIVMYRDGKKKKVDVELGERKKAYVTIDIDEDGRGDRRWFNMRPLGGGGRIWMDDDGGVMMDAFGNRWRLGLELHSMDEDLAGYFDAGKGEGLLVLGVVEGSPAGEAGVRAGDVLVSVGGTDISEMDDVLEALEDVEDDEKVEIVVIRRGDRKKFGVELDEAEKGFYRVPRGIPGAMPRAVPVPGIREFEVQRLKGMEEAELEKKMQELEKTMKQLEKKLEELQKKD